MIGTPLIIDEEVRSQIRALIEISEANPVDIVGLTKRLEDPEAKKFHTEQMTRQTITVPLTYMVTYSIELGHPCGKCRHMSMSVQRQGRVPSEHGLWMVAQELGFWGNLDDCAGIWKEELQGHGVAVNIVQPYEVPTQRRRPAA